MYILYRLVHSRYAFSLKNFILDLAEEQKVLASLESEYVK